MADLITIGPVRTVRVVPDPQDAEVFMLALTREAGEALQLPVMREALRGLWSNLTHLLYPHAADQLTNRMDTVMRRVEGIPRNLTHTVTAYTDTVHTEIIMVGGFCHACLWTMALNRQTSEDLWTSLEDLLNQI